MGIKRKNKKVKEKEWKRRKKGKRKKERTGARAGRRKNGLQLYFFKLLNKER